MIRERDRKRTYRERQIDAARIVAGVGAFWAVSDLAYYIGLPALGRNPDYNSDPLAISLFYLFWIGVSVILFWPILKTWGQYARWPTFASRGLSLAAWCMIFVAGVGFPTYVMPGLSPVAWSETWGAPPDIILASQDYFLPKSLEIAFQQLLMVTLILALAPLRLRFLTLSFLCAGLFGSIHILLIFGNLPLPGVARFSAFAAVFGFMMPWLILRVRNGIAVSYALHWAYYAATIVMLRVLGPGSALDLLQPQ